MDGLQFSVGAELFQGPDEFSPAAGGGPAATGAHGFEIEWVVLEFQ